MAIHSTMEIAAAQLLYAFHKSIAKSNAQNSQSLLHGSCIIPHYRSTVFFGLLHGTRFFDCAIFITRCDVCEHTNSLCV